MCSEPFEVTHGNQLKCPTHRGPKSVIRACRGCGCKIQSRKNQVFCSTCQEKLKLHPLLVCPVCEKSFRQRGVGQKYCSPTCKWARRHDQTRDCKTCGTPFKPVGPQVYCKDCKPKHLRRKPRIYQQYKGTECERCGFTPEHSCQLDVHHKDGDPFNNDPSNFQTLCANCHRLTNVGPRTVAQAA